MDCVVEMLRMLGVAIERQYILQDQQFWRSKIQTSGYGAKHHSVVWTVVVEMLKMLGVPRLEKLF